MSCRSAFRPVLLVLSLAALFLFSTPVHAQTGVPCELSLPVCNGDCPPGQSCVSDPVQGCFCEAAIFPPAGTDLSPTSGIVQVDVQGIGPVELRVDGTTLLQFSDAQTDPVSGERTVQTEILSMDLVGTSPQLGSVQVRAGQLFGLPPTLGEVRPLGPPGGADFPALATFDVFFEVEVSGENTLRNQLPLVMEAVIDEIPPRSIGLRNANQVELIDVLDPTHIDTIQTAVHWMCPPPFPPPGVPCPVPCDQAPFPACTTADCPPGSCSVTATNCQTDADCPAGETCLGGGLRCISDSVTQACICAEPFPPAGTDLSPSTGIFRVDVPFVGSKDTSVSGDLLLEWQDPVVDPVSGQRTVQTEMLSMDLTGSDPSLGSLEVRAGSNFGLPPSLGSVTPSAAGGDFPALATFDVFFEVVIAGVATLRNDEPLVMEAEITEIPPRNIGLRNVSPILLADVLDPSQLNVIQTALHWMCPPPFPPPGVPCPVPCSAAPYPACSPGQCTGANEQCTRDEDGRGCVCRPGFPPLGTDLSPSTGIFRVDIAGVGPVDASVSGDLLLQWQDPVADPVTGERTVQTEMLSMDLSGSHPSIGNIRVRGGSQQGLPPSLGTVVPEGPGSDFPATASFDVFFEVEVDGVGTLNNDAPLVMVAEIDEIPPRSVTLTNESPVEIEDPATPGVSGTIQTSGHWMCPPPFPPPGVPCPVPCSATPFPACDQGACDPNERCAEIPLSDGSGVCRCVPNDFPIAGTDLSPSTGIFRVDIPGIGPVDTSVSGEVLLEWQNPVADPVSGQRTVQTEMLSMDLTGSHPSIGPIQVRGGSQFGLPPSLGDVVPLSSGGDFPATASFDVFFEVDVSGVGTLSNSQPLVMQAVIDEIPPRNLALRNLAPVVLEDPMNPGASSDLQISAHWMCPPPFPPPGVPCPVPCAQNPFPVCSEGDCPPDTPLCVPDDTTGLCRCVGPFPPGGFDLSPTTGIVRVDVFGIGPVDVEVSGETLLQYSDPVVDPVSGQRTVQTEMLSLDLSGVNPVLGDVRVRAGSSGGYPATVGQVASFSAGGPDFPATATFDVFFEVEVDGGAHVLRNPDPLPMQATIIEIPPRNLALQSQSSVQLEDDDNPGQISTILTAFHWMCPPPFPPPGVPCPIPCASRPFPTCDGGDCPAGFVCAPQSTGVCDCISPAIGSGSSDGLRVDKVPGSVGSVELTWDLSCLATDNDFGVYAGTLARPFDTHAAVQCGTGGATQLTIGPTAGSRYYLVVPQNGTTEGSYGDDGSGTPRLPGAGACLPQLSSTCP